MKLLNSTKELNEFRQSLTSTVGFVPTMGALHDGHISLIRASLSENDSTFVSVFINPTQFNDASDFQTYPRTLEQDLELLRDLKITAAFVPSDQDIYPNGYTYKITENAFSRELCGKFRPGHFDGVLTVVMKLLNLIKPHICYFGEKDFQQYLLIQNMVLEFFMPTRIKALPTRREPDGLAMSSRNVRLKPRERELAPMLYKVISQTKSLRDMQAQLEELGFNVEYLEEQVGRRFVAAHLGSVRLIDNVPI